MEKKIMILGAGVFQLSAIKKAVSMGYYVITADNIQNNIGHSYSHQQVHCSTIDMANIASFAIELEIDGICTFSSDVAIPTVGYVNDLMGLCGLDYSTAVTMSNKNIFRSFLRKKGLTHPDYISFDRLEELIGFISKKGNPLIIKPVDASGSRGVYKLNNENIEEAETAIISAKEFSRSGFVIVEDYLEGMEVGGDAFLSNGQISFIVITHKHMDRFLVSGHSLPSNLSISDQERVKNSIEKCCNLLGYNNGPINFDVMVMHDQVVIIEMSPRNGGNGIPDITCITTGFDLEKATIEFSLGSNININQNTAIIAKCAGSVVFGSECEGILEHIDSFETVHSKVPELFDLKIAVQPGSAVKPFIHNGNLIGYALFEYSKPDQYKNVVERFRKAINVKVLS